MVVSAAQAMPLASARLAASRVREGRRIGELHMG
jgi:hypothetical protein